MVKTVLSFAEEGFSKPVSGLHRLGMHFTSTYVALLAINNEQKKGVAFQLLEPVHPFDINEATEVRQMIDYFISQHEWFSDSSVSTSVLIPGNGLTLVPSDVFDSYSKELILEPQYQVQSGDIVYTEKIGDSPYTTVYALPWSWNQQLRSRFTDLKLFHEDVCWLNIALTEQGKNLPETAAILYVEFEKLKIQLIKKRKLLYYNSFYYQGKEDILYYLQLALNQFGMGTSMMDIFLAGTGFNELALESFLKQYSSSVNLLKFPFYNTLPASLRKNYPSLYLALFSLALCG